MSEIINISGATSHLAPTFPPVTTGPSREAAVGEPSGRTDTVEISGLGTAMSRITGDSSLRLARINAIRAEIADGTFESPQRIMGTVDRLLDVIG